MRKTVKIQTLDTIFSLCIRESYDYICQYPGSKRKGCEYCGNHSLRDIGGLENSHYYRRRASGGRFHPDNCIALCHDAHSYIDTHPAKQHGLMVTHLGETRHEMLVCRMHETFKYSPVERAEMNAHYRAQLKYIERMRTQGHTGYFPIAAWD